MDHLTVKPTNALAQAKSIFQHDFKIRTRMNRLLGLWVAHLLELQSDKAQEYVDAILILDLTYGTHGVLERVQKDLEAANVPVDEFHLSDAIDHFWEAALKSVVSHAL